MAAFTAPTYAACICALIIIFLGFVFFVRSYLVDSTATARIWHVNLRMAMLRASAGSTQTLLTVGTYQDFLNVYRKPMISSLSDLQAIISMQVCDMFAQARCHASMSGVAASQAALWAKMEHSSCNIWIV